ncbi:DUF6961 family protein [Sphingomonas sp. PAMC 26605]|uniref:DUF6961 family protein n=1 Tax=Sphingomonas sp. PAMC 26605 TaxID=1112214 RepID=UPI003FA479A4
MTLNEQRERWAEALAIEKTHGERARRWVAERIGDLALQGDSDGIARLRSIAALLDQLRRHPNHVARCAAFD